MRNAEAFVVSQNTGDDHLGELIDVEDCVELIVTVTSLHLPSVYATWDELQIQLSVYQPESAFNDAFPVRPERWQNLQCGAKCFRHRLPSFTE
ncbi:hypothetical protein D9M71_740400 [compost metagenome]